MQVDVLIVGQGLAGSLLAWTLMQRQYRVLVLDPGGENASQVAAGLINPVTGQRLVKQRDTALLLAAARNCYQQLAMKFGQAFFVEMPMWRILLSENERVLADKRIQQQEYQEFLAGWRPEIVGVSSAFGVLQQMQTGFLRTQLLLAKLREFFIAADSYRQGHLDYSELNLRPYLQWQDVRSKHLVFCEGYHAQFNPWFGHLPFQLSKGEILSAETVALLPNQILNYGRWLIPLGGRCFKTGATFDGQALDVLPTSAAEATLLQALYRVLPALQGRVKINAHQAGIRPTTLDKQPFIGVHPQYSNLHIFNGFGAKGSLSIPWYALYFIDLLEQRQFISSAHIKRYYETHFPT